MKKFAKTISLIGFSSSGKTTLGKKLAEFLHCRFVDTDQLIEESYSGLSCREIFHLHGEEIFRNCESKVIGSLQFRVPFVLATGGGSLIRDCNAICLQLHTTLIYLKTAPEILKKRLKHKNTHPAYLNPDDIVASFDKLYQERKRLYEKWAHHIVEMDERNEESALIELSTLASTCKE